MSNQESKGKPGAGESIGRPAPWGETRYEEDGKPDAGSVLRKPGEGPVDTTSTPVTLEDYVGPAK